MVFVVLDKENACPDFHEGNYLFLDYTFYGHMTIESESQIKAISND